MKLFRSLSASTLLVASALFCFSFVQPACGGVADLGGAHPDAGDVSASDSGAGSNRPNQDEPDMPLVPATKVDVLFVVDNSAGMSTKQDRFADGVGRLLRRVAPNRDVHVGVITSSLGGRGGDVCPDNDDDTNGRAHLQTRGVAASAVPQGFLSYASGGNVDTLVSNTAALVRGVGNFGCGIEATLEAAYRFLVQPDPWYSVVHSNTGVAVYEDVDNTILEQRADFLRPDSLVLVVVVTDEDDASFDPRSIAGQGWAFGAKQFPGSRTFRSDNSTTAPRGTSVCATDPASAACMSCGFAATCKESDPACAALRADPACQENGGYFGSDDDSLNVRFHRMKERYGIDPLFPISRYVDGFSRPAVPSLASEHPVAGGAVQPYDGTGTCRNPLFAAALPRSAGDEICNLPRGPRSRELVIFATLAGVVPSLVATNNPNWTAIVGANPLGYDYSGIDPHMVQSVSPRAGLAAPSSVRGDNGTDPINGREWNTQKDDLQYACTFALPSPRVCTDQDRSCPCGTAATNPPVCGATFGTQLRDAAYPGVRPLLVAQGLAGRGVASSICTTDASPTYDGAMDLIAERVLVRLAD